MSNEESAIFFANFPNIPHILKTKSLKLSINLKKNSWKKLISTEVSGLRILPKFSRLIIDKLFISSVTFEVIETTKGGLKLETLV